jgi:RNA polymerase sigma factor (sigma-70 family)
MVSQRQDTELVKRVSKLQKQGLTYEEIADSLWISITKVNHAISARNHGLSTTAEYEDFLANQKGYDNFSNYVKVREIMREKLGKKERDQIDFEEQMKRLPISEISDIIDEQEMPPIEQGEDSEPLYQAIKLLPERERYIIRKRYFEGKTLKDTGKELAIGGERIRQIEKRALRKIKWFLESEKRIQIAEEARNPRY